jgi:hypothetical protein
MIGKGYLEELVPQQVRAMVILCSQALAPERGKGPVHRGFGHSHQLGQAVQADAQRVAAEFNQDGQHPFRTDEPSFLFQLHPLSSPVSLSANRYFK